MSSKSGLGMNANTIASITVIVSFVLASLFTVSAVAEAQQSDSPLSCLDVSKEELQEEINQENIRKVNNEIQENPERIPDSVRSAMVGERINIDVDSEYFSTRVSENARIEWVQTTAIEDPTMKVTTDCRTIKGIVESDNKEAALRDAIDRNAITWDGLTTSSEIETSYGGKAVQTYTIVSSNETGNAGDAAEGFSSGLSMS